VKEFLQISLIQADLFWLNKKKNISLFDDLISKIDKTDIILLPEMFNTSFSPSNIDLSEDMNGPTISWMKSIAKKKKCSISGTLMVNDKGKVYNRLIWVFENGSLLSYDKSHLFSLAKEEKTIHKGNKKIIIEQSGWRICPLICYDLRFPVFCRNNDEYDVLVFLSSWPEKRIDAWNILLKARAIENQCISVGVNRIGVDNSGINFPGESNVYNSFGQKILTLGDQKNTVKTIVLSKEKLSLRRRQMSFLKDRDSFSLH